MTEPGLAAGTYARWRASTLRSPRLINQDALHRFE
jgi:hypothetical protein